MNIDRNIKQSISYCLKKDGPFSWSKILGFTKEELKKRLEEQFTPEMSFENYGKVWGVSFHIPRRLYKIQRIKDPDFLRCWNLKNIKPELLEKCYRQKKKISKKELDNYSLWDILPNGNIAKYLVE